jgi:hypothetical protein
MPGCRMGAGRVRQGVRSIGQPSRPIITLGLGSRFPWDLADSAAVFSLWQVLHIP